MRLGIMQPYFFPYLGYFALIEATDHFVVFDPVQYIRHGWINRNRMLKPGFGEPQYFRVPIAAHRRETLIRDIRIAKGHDWKNRIFRQLQHYARQAPYFSQAISILGDCLAIQTDSIVRLNVHCLEVACQALQIPFEFTYFDEIDGPIQPARHPGDWALHTAGAMRATTYVNPIGGRNIFDPEQFQQHDIELLFLEHSLPHYPQPNDSFVAGLSLLDVLMFNSLAETRALVAQYKTTTARLCTAGADR